MRYCGRKRFGPGTVLVIVLLCAAAAAAAVLFLGQGAQQPSAPTASPSAAPTPEPTLTPTPTPIPTPTSSEYIYFNTAIEPTPTPEPYDFSQPVPESEEAPMEYFADAVFVGDSRTDGFLRYSGVEGADGIYYTGLSIFGMQDKKVIGTGENKKTVLEALAEKQYGKIYLALGVNELGYRNDTLFYETYREVIAAIRQVQPDAIIYIENLIPVNESQVSRSYLRNDHLRAYNDLIAQAAEEEQVACLDLYSAFADENGQLPKDASNDGVHMKKPYCEKWLAYLRSHTVKRTDMGLEEEKE